MNITKNEYEQTTCRVRACIARLAEHALEMPEQLDAYRASANEIVRLWVELTSNLEQVRDLESYFIAQAEITALFDRKLARLEPDSKNGIASSPLATENAIPTFDIP